VTGGGHLARLAARATQPDEGVRPRRMSVFEQRDPGGPAPQPDPGPAPAPATTAVARAPGGALEDDARPGGPVGAVGAPTRPRDKPAEPPSPSMARAPQRPAAATPGQPSARREAPATRVVRARAAQRDPAVGTSAPDRDDAGTGDGWVTRSPAAPSAPNHPGAHHTPTPSAAPTSGTAVVPGHAAGTGAPARHAAAAPPVRGPGEGGDLLAAPQEVAVHRGATDAVPAPPRLDPQALDPRAPDPQTHPPQPPVSSVRPRIRAGAETETETERASSSPEPAVTVTIGRIEVLPPQPAPPTKEARASATAQRSGHMPMTNRIISHRLARSRRTGLI
jgi:hypothetical protein